MTRKLVSEDALPIFRQLLINQNTFNFNTQKIILRSINMTCGTTFENELMPYICLKAT